MSHAVYGPSAANRWMTCTASVDLIAKHFPDGTPSSEYAQEGTWAHELIPMLYAGEPTDQWEKDVPEDYHEEMFQHARGYLAQLEALQAPVTMLEQRVYTPRKEIWGTADTIMVDGGTLYVIDYKYGRGVGVSAGNNPQLKLYAIGALELIQDLFGGISVVKMGIYQPRASGDRVKWSDEVSPQDLMDWFTQEVEPALDEKPPQYRPSASACRFCPVAGICEARMKQQVERDFGVVGEMTNAQIAQALDQIEDLEVWIKQVRQAALTMTYERGERLPGWKVVRGTGRRTITDQEAAIKALMKKGYRRRDVARSQTVTLSALDKIVGGKDRLAQLLGEHLRYSEGKPTLAPESDPREEVSSVEAEFTPVNDNEKEA